MQSLPDLQSPDEATLRFTPLGLATGHKLRPEAAAEFQQKAVDVPLADAMPDQVRDSFKRVQLLHAYGVLSYELFTAAHDLTRLIMEQALRARFMEYHGDEIPLVSKDGTPQPLAASTFNDLYHALNRGTHRKAQRLLVRDGDGTIEFKGSLNHLLVWARTEGFLDGQRNRMLEPTLVAMRNDVAHPSNYHLVMPVDSSRAIRDLAEIINRLWGAVTPEGRLYPGPVRRDVMAIGWSENGESLVRAHAEHLAVPDDKDIVHFVLVRAFADDPHLWNFNARLETTHFPSEYLWGPGSQEEALAWLKTVQPQPDETDYFDRLFLVRESDGRADLPFRPEACAALPPEERMGTWHLVVADHPADALLHVRRLIEGTDGCATDGPCDSCPAESVFAGTWAEALTAYEDRNGPIESALAPDLWVPGPGSLVGAV